MGKNFRQDRKREHSNNDQRERRDDRKDDEERRQSNQPGPSNKNNSTQSRQISALEKMVGFLMTTIMKDILPRLNLT